MTRIIPTCISVLLVFVHFRQVHSAAVYNSTLDFGCSDFNTPWLHFPFGVSQRYNLLQSEPIYPAHSVDEWNPTTIYPREHSLDLRPTPAPTGNPSPSTSIHITDEHDFSLLLPGRESELISDAEGDGVAFCTADSKDSSCSRHVSEGFIRAAAIQHADDGSWVQITGCIDPSKSSLDPTDDGGQFDVRFPNGAQCAFGGYGASFIEQVEPASSRFCLRCCASANDQVHCNSHQDRAGCLVAIPGRYDFPELGVSCS